MSQSGKSCTSICCKSYVNRNAICNFGRVIASLSIDSELFMIPATVQPNRSTCLIVILTLEARAQSDAFNSTASTHLQTSISYSVVVGQTANASMSAAYDGWFRCLLMIHFDGRLLSVSERQIAMPLGRSESETESLSTNNIVR